MFKLNNGQFLALGNCSVLFLIELGTLKVWKALIFLISLHWLRRNCKIEFARIFCFSLEGWHIIPTWSHRDCLRHTLSLLLTPSALKQCIVSYDTLELHKYDPEGWDGEGGGRWGSGWGTHVNPWLIHVNVWQKPLQYCKVISLQLIKINGKKRKK